MRLRRPGRAVVFVLVYAGFFAAALWSIRASSPMMRARKGPPPARPPAVARRNGRSALLAGSGLADLARDEYFRGLSTACCPCGCEFSLRDCLVSDEACVKSPELAEALIEQLR